ncbi:Cof-type HAD-IIB family hydrolase [Bacillus weihaiensis]|uniref:HAD family hydrolase n=1 Tax=Bacillus weihaiensis TaxID=1547283 RepID=A0A1L3MMX7_9BACI|nr:Cof-type HAD-IIB family hydrolase [Bacillus weihaiensis]APH03703.1 HAD family hydrolase [Bacillus weihaiensis]
MFQPKAIFLDMDGTILNHQNFVSNKTKEIIDQLRAEGLYVFIATGRSYDEIGKIVPEGFAVDGFVTSNGMAGYVGDEVVFEHSLDRDLVEKIIELARKHKVYYELFPYGASRLTLKQDQPYVEEAILDPKPESVGMNEWSSRKQALKDEIAWLEEIEGDKFSKFYFFSKSQEHINSWKEELDRMKKEVNFTTSISSPHNVELMVANVSKASGIKKMLQKFGLSKEDTLAIGDSDNDISMLQLVGYPVAMQNAPAHIKELARAVTPFSCDEDGVYHYLKSYVK